MNDKKQDSGILLIGHGSRLPYNKEVIDKIAEKYSEIMPNYNIEVGYMELCEPSISQAFNKLKETGVDRIIVTPVFLADGMHTKRDIPKILGLKPEIEETNEEHHHDHEHGHEHGHHHHHHDEEPQHVEFDGEIIYTKPLGADDLIVDIVASRVNEHL